MNSTIRMGQFLDDLSARFDCCEPEAKSRARESGNVRVITAQYEALGRGDLQALRGLLTDDMVLEIIGPPGSPIAGRWEGRDAALEAAARNFALFAEQEPRPEFVTANGDTVTVVAREKGVYLPTGRAYDTLWLQTFVVRDGKVAQVREVITSPAPWEL